MCGIAAVLSLDHEPVPGISRALAVMNRLQAHRGPDGEGTWVHPDGFVGLGHRRLAVIDPAGGAQPMAHPSGDRITYNGLICNYLELRQRLPGPFRGRSDTEVLLHAYAEWGPEHLRELRGMYAFAVWDEARRTLFAARDPFGIKPLCYAIVGRVLYLASEAKALLPFLPAIETDLEGFRDYLTFQFCLEGKTLFRGVRELPPGHALVVSRGNVHVERHWQPTRWSDRAGTPGELEAELRTRLEESIDLHLRADVPIGVSLSGGVDSSVVASLAAAREGRDLAAFTGKFSIDPAYDESRYARALTEFLGLPLEEIDIGEDDFCDAIERVIYHLDFPVAGPGSFAQFVVSGVARRDRKVLLGGQGGDELFGGYARYLLADLEQCLKRAIDGDGTERALAAAPALLGNLRLLQGYKPLLREFWREGLFDDLDRRYFRLIDRSTHLDGEIRWDALSSYDPFETFRRIFGAGDDGDGSSFDRMMRFDAATSLAALLHVEDRVAMAHGLESRVPLLDLPLAEFAASTPADLKIRDGVTKHVLRRAMRDRLPAAILERGDKMGFPVPLSEWLSRPGRVRDFVGDLLSSRAARERALIDNRAVAIDGEPRFGRKIWGLVCLELWQRTFHDRAAEFATMAGEGQT